MTRLYRTADVQYNAKNGRMMRESPSSLKLQAVYCIKHDKLTSQTFLSSSRRVCFVFCIHANLAGHNINRSAEQYYYACLKLRACLFSTCRPPEQPKTSDIFMNWTLRQSCCTCTLHAVRSHHASPACRQNLSCKFYICAHGVIASSIAT